MNVQIIAFDGLSALGIQVVELGIKSLLLMLVVTMMVALFRRSSAATRHCIWTFGLASTLSLPLLNLCLPRVAVPGIPSFDQRPVQARTAVASHGFKPSSLPQPIMQSRARTQPVSAHTAILSEELRRTKSSTSEAPPAMASSPATSSSAELSREKQPTAPSRGVAVSPLAIIALFWLLIAGILLMRVGWSWLAARKLIRHVVRVDLSDFADELGDIHRHARSLLAERVCVSSEPMSPYVVGLLRPQIVVPEESLQWNRERLAAVLRHELAHIQRRDLLSQFIARLSSALFWFNPLMWLAEAKLQLERELACDDLASQGRDAHRYAQHLLDIARLHSRQRATLVVSMVRPKDLELRITAMLDASKSRIRVSRRQAIALLSVIAIAGLLVALAGPMGSDATAQAPQGQANSNTTDSNAADSKAAKQPDAKQLNSKQPEQKKPGSDDAPPKPEMRAMRVRVIDADGKPLAGVKIHNNASVEPKAEGARPFIQTIDYHTDQQGAADMVIPVESRRLRLWAIMPHYVPLFASWEPNELDLGKKIPDEYVFTLERGVKIGGKVLDQSGNPIAGVSVHVRADRVNRQELKAGQAVVNPWLSEEDTVQTDEQGNWFIDNAPPAGADEYTFSTRFVHPDLISDDNWGQTQDRSNVKTAQLRDLSAVFRMTKGTAIKGRVTLPNGKPASEGIVIWHREPYFTPGSQECPIQADGAFTTAALPEGEHPLTVVVPGYSPWFQQVRVYPEMGPVDVQLEPGHSLTIRIQDAKGQPIPQAYISTQGWKQVESLYNVKHSNVLSTEIPYRADDEGVFRWTWAPEDGVKYRISATGYSYREVVLSASPEEHVITLSKPLRITGNVTDKTTGLPVQTFDVIPVHVFRPDWLNAFYPNAAVGRDGKYLLDGEVRQTDRPYRVRIEADGYRTAMSPVDIDVTAGSIEVDFQLEPAAPLVGNVVSPDGRPAAGANVQFATPTVVPHLSNNATDGSRLVLARTDDQGKLTWRAQFEPLLVRVVHEQGFAELELAVGQQPGTIRLQPWASVKGRLTQAGKPVANQRVHFWPQEHRGLDQPRFQEQYYVITDADGRFEFERLPPLAGSLRAYLGPWEDSPLQSSQSVPLDLKPGDKLNVELGGSGARITGQVVPIGRGGAELDEGYSLNYLVARRPGIAVPPKFLPPEFDADHPFDESALSTLSSNPWLSARDYYFVKLSPEGYLNVHGVPAGEYDLVIQLYERPVGCLVEAIGQRVVPVTISPSNVASGTLKLGRIEVPCRVGPRIGSNMDLYAFTDATGRGRTIADERGKHVVLQFWATWCAPCLESMKSIQPQIDRLNNDKLIIAAINIDSDPREAKRFATANGFTWANDFVGAKSEIAQQLAISSLPAYFLIDGEGKLAATATSWEAIEKELRQRKVMDE